jgi:hypothetical protein
MAIQGVSIALSTEDVARSVKFYVEQLGFTCSLQLEGFARVRLGAADIMLVQPNAQSSLARPALYRLGLSERR